MYLCIPQFYYIKIRFNGVYIMIIRTSFQNSVGTCDLSADPLGLPVSKNVVVNGSFGVGLNKQYLHL